VSIRVCPGARFAAFARNGPVFLVPASAFCCFVLTVAHFLPFPCNVIRPLSTSWREGVGSTVTPSRARTSGYRP